MSEEQKHPKILFCDGVAKISADKIYIEPRSPFTEDAIEKILSILRAEIKATQEEQLKRLIAQMEKDTRRLRCNSKMLDSDPGPVCQLMPDGTIKMSR